MDKVVRVGLGNESALIWLLDEELVSLLLGEHNGIFLRLEVDIGTLHTIGGRLPANERVLPSVTLLQNIPIHAPVVGVPVSRLRCRLRWAIDPVRLELTTESRSIGGTHTEQCGLVNPWEHPRGQPQEQFHRAHCHP